MPIEIVKFTPCHRNTLRGFLTVRITGLGLEIRDITVHEKLESGGKWLNMPNRSYQDENGELKWSYVVYMYDKEKKREFDRAVFDKLKEMDRKPEEKEIEEKDIPF